MTIETEIAANRRRIRAGIEDPLMRHLISEYERIIDRIESDAEALARSIGANPTRSQVLRLRRLQALEAQVRTEMARVSRDAAVQIRASRQVAIVGAIRDAAGVAAEVGVGVNPPAIERIVASLQPGSPLQALVAELPVQASVAVREALIDGVVLGRNPREVAQGVRMAMGGQQARALTIARTEVLRAYRGAAIETFRENARNIGGWVWISAQDSTTCGFCWAQHGTEHPNSEAFASHPNCRCSPGPIPRVNPPEIRSGVDRFAELPESQQRAILGPAKHRAYQDGVLDLRDLVGHANDPRWGRVGFEKPLRSVLGQRRAVEFYRGRAA